MVTPEYQAFFLASVGASAGLIGLLFVSVSIAPERVFGEKSESRRQAQALSAFTALANILFISMTSLIPGVQVGLVVTITAGVALLQTVGLVFMIRGWRRDRELFRGGFLFLASAAIYGTELYLGATLWMKPSSTGALIGLLEVLLGAYAIGLGRAWELLGAPRMGLITYVLGLLDRSGPKPKP